MPGPVRVAVDAGHGGSDRGATCPGFVESGYNLMLARYFVARVGHSYEPVRPYMVRGADVEMTLRDRAEYVEKEGADLVVSLHVNAGPPGLRGAMCFHWPRCRESREVAQAISRCMPPPLLRGDRVWAATGHEGPIDDWLQRPRNVLEGHRPTPAVLVEVGFCSHDPDLDALNSPATQAGICTALVAGVDRLRQLREASCVGPPADLADLL